MTSTASIAQIYLAAQAEFDAIIREGGDSRKLAMISFLACDICLELCEDMTPQTAAILGEMSQLFASLTKEWSAYDTRAGRQLQLANKSCDLASKKLAQIFMNATRSSSSE